MFLETNTKPLVVTAEHVVHGRDNWVLKPFGRLGEVNSIRELVGHRFAVALGIPVLEAGILEIGENVIRTSPTLRERLAGSVGPNFGSRYRAGLVDLTSPDQVQREQRSAATHIYGWDALADNLDRKGRPSNVLAGDSGVFAIDHEMTFSWFGVLGGPGPKWVINILYRIIREHFFRDHVNRWGCGYNGLSAALTALTSADLAAVTSDVPARWQQGEGDRCIGQIRQYLNDVQARAGEIIAAIDSRRLA